jgi:single-strand DNA-binding protein
VDSISVTATGKLGGAPASGVTQRGTTWASFSLAVDVPARNSDRSGGERQYDTRWYKVWCYGALADHVASSLVKGDRVTVRADDLSCHAWTDDTPERKTRGQAELKAYDVAASMRFENLVTAKAARTGTAPAEAAAPADGDPWADGGQVTQTGEVPEVLNGVTR